MSVDALLSDIGSGRYRPRAGTAGEVLVLACGESCRAGSERSLALFARLALRHEGVWWAMALDSDPDTLSPDEVHWLASTWRAWRAGASPWRSRRRVSA